MSNAPSIPPVVPPVGSSPVLPVRAPKRRLWLTLLLVFLVFVGGGVFGAAVTVIIAVRRAQNVATHPELIPPRLAQVIKRRLNLNAVQTAEVERILAARQLRLQQVRLKVKPEVDEELEGARAEISQILRPEQQRKWDAAYEDIKAKWLPQE